MSLLDQAYSALLRRWPYSHRSLWVIGGVLAVEGTYWLSNLALYGVYKSGRFEQWKIQSRKWPDRKLVQATIVKSLVRTLVISPLAANFLLYPAFKYFGTDVGARVPGGLEILRQQLLFIMTNDTLFYWAHRMLHHPAIYKHIHKQHHEYKAVIGVSATYAHPVEEVLANTLPVVLAAMLIGAHPVSWWLWLVVRMLETVDAHSGYAFPFSPFHLLDRLQGGAERHDFHHSHNIGNFGSFTTFWDWVTGTDRAYNDWRARRAAAGAKGEQANAEHDQ